MEANHGQGLNVRGVWVRSDQAERVQSLHTGTGALGR